MADEAGSADGVPGALPTAAVRRRRRGPALETAIRAAVLELVVEGGASAVTMEAVAARVGTSKPVLYRRWPDRAALLRDTLVPLAQDAIPQADTGSYRGDMIAVLRGWAQFFGSPEGAVGPAIVGALPHDAELAEAFRQGVIGWRKHAMEDILRRGIDRGEVRAEVRVDVARELGQALLWHRFLVTGDEITPELIEHIVDAILVPYTAPDSPAATATAEGRSSQARSTSATSPGSVTWATWP